MGKHLLNSSCVMDILLSPGRAKNKRFFYILGILIEKSSLGKQLVSRILLLMANTRRMQIFFIGLLEILCFQLYFCFIHCWIQVTLISHSKFHFLEEELKESNIKFLIVMSDNSIWEDTL